MNLSQSTLGLAIGDPIIAQAVFDELFLSGTGFESIPLDRPGHSLDLEIGALLSFDETDDEDFGSGYPVVDFQDGVWVGFSLITTPFTGPAMFGLDLLDADVEIYSADSATFGATALLGTLTTASISPH